MIALKLSKGPFPAEYMGLFRDYLNWAERNLTPDTVLMAVESDARFVGSEPINIFMKWTPRHGHPTSGYLCALFFEFADPVDLNDFL